jgi:GT2 family glycosyltransferase
MSRLFLTVIIPTYKRNDLLFNCLSLLSPEKQTLNSNSYEVIVTDDSSNLLAKELSGSFPWAKFIEGPQKGPASNRNNGAKNANGNWLVFIDDDCLPDTRILETYYHAIEIGGFQAFEGEINADRPRQRFDEESPLNLTGNCFWSCNIAIEKELYTNLNGFDEGFPYAAMEDTDLFERLAKISKHNFLPEAKVIHPWRRVKPFQNFKKRLLSNQYSLNKAQVKRTLYYRYKRLKLCVGVILSDTKLLVKCSFKGFGVYIDRVCFQIVMLFI